MFVTFSTGTQEESLDLDASMSGSQLCELLAGILGAPLQHMWMVNGQGVRPPPASSALAALQSAGLKEGDVVMVTNVAAPSSRGGRNGAAGAPAGARGGGARGTPVSFPGMSADDVFGYNSHPQNVAAVFRRPEHAQALLELRFHHAELAGKIKDAKTDDEAASHVRAFILARSAEHSLDELDKERARKDMRGRWNELLPSLTGHCSAA
jgi:hypothetical protein